MKAYAVALFLLIFNIVLSILSDLQIFTMLAPQAANATILLPYDQGIIDQASSYINYQPTGLETLDMIRMLGIMFTAIFNATVGLPFLLSSLGIPAIIIPLIVLPVYYAYLAAVVQIVTGRTFPFFE